jgi:phosphate acetyltransferase
MHATDDRSSTACPGQVGSKFERLIAAARSDTPALTVVAYPCDAISLRGALEARDEGLIAPTLVGPRARILDVAQAEGLDLDGVEIVDTPHSHASAAEAVRLVREGRGELLMKGSLHTDELMREVAASATGLRTERRISHVFIMNMPGHAETLFITNAAINNFLDVDAKRNIVQRRATRRDPLGRRGRWLSRSYSITRRA